MSKEQFTIDKVVVFPNYNLQDVRKGMYKIPMSEDSLAPYAYKNMYVIDPQHKFKPKVLTELCILKKEICITAPIIICP